MSELRTLHCLRVMAWERAKGEMQAMLQTYYSDSDGDKYERFEKELKAFVEHIEDEGLHE